MVSVVAVPVTLWALILVPFWPLFLLFGVGKSAAKREKPNWAALVVLSLLVLIIWALW